MSRTPTAQPALEATGDVSREFHRETHLDNLFMEVFDKVASEGDRDRGGNGMAEDEMPAL